MSPAPDLESWSRSLADGLAQNGAGTPAAAERTFTALLRRIEAAGCPDEALVVRARAHLGRAVSIVDRRSDLRRALDDIDAAERLAQAAGALPVLVAAHGQRALVALSTGRTGEAVAHFDAAVDMLEFAEPHDQHCVLLNRGALHLEQGDLEAARRDLVRCATLSASRGDGVLEFKARHNLGYVEYLAGNLPTALAEMAAAARLDAGGPWATALLDQARVLRDAGLVGEADGALRAAEGIYRHEGVAQGVAETVLARAECALTTDADAARRLAAEASRRFRRRGNIRWLHKAEYVGLLADLSATSAGTGSAGGRPSPRRLRAVARHATDLAGRCADQGLTELARSAGLVAATALLMAGDPVTDRPTIARHDPLSVRLQVHEVRARAASAAGDVRAARTAVRAGLDEVCAYQARFGSLDMRTSSAVHGVALATLDMDLALETGRAVSVFASIERTRAASSRLTPVQPPPDEDAAARLAELRQVEEEIRAHEGGEDPRLRSLQARATELRAAVRAQAWRREGTRDRAAVRSTTTVEALRAELARTDAVLVSVAAHRGVLHAVVLADGRIAHHPLGPATAVDELVRRTRADLDVLALPHIPAPIRPTVLASLRSSLRALDDALLAPLGLGDAPLVVSPTGPLALLPWSLLPSRRGLPVVVAPSASSWHRAAATPSTRAGAPRVAAVAGPGLVRAAEEADAVAAQWSGTVLREATADGVVRALGQADLVHVAAHGRHEPDNPLFSSVRLADGPLFAHEMEAVESMADCLVLSACEVGQWSVRPGNEPLGLTTALLQLGARCVVAGVARVGDDAAADISVRLHRRLAAGADTATALALTQAESDDDVVAPLVCFGSAWRPAPAR